MEDLDFDKHRFLLRLGKNIARIRKSKAYSQDKLQLESGLSRGTLSNIEAGKKDAKASTLAKIAEVLDVPVGKLFDFKKP